MREPTDACALWYMRWYQVRYDLFDSEQDGARQAVYLREEGQGVSLGVQFPDGRAVKVEEWPAYDEAKRRWEASERAQEARIAAEPRPTRSVRDPFEGAIVDVKADAPEWLGRPPTLS